MSNAEIVAFAKSKLIEVMNSSEDPRDVVSAARAILDAARLATEQPVQQQLTDEQRREVIAADPGIIAIVKANLGAKDDRETH